VSPTSGDATAEPSGCAAALAMTGATVPVAAVLTIAWQWHGVFLPIFVVSLLIVALLGGMSFLRIRRDSPRCGSLRLDSPQDRSSRR
jgi:hypothetical protein